jgi:hypothetical protein
MRGGRFHFFPLWKRGRKGDFTAIQKTKMLWAGLLGFSGRDPHPSELGKERIATQRRNFPGRGEINQTKKGDEGAKIRSLEGG